MMKRRSWVCLAGMAGLFWFSAAVFGEVLVSESFDYDPGSIEDMDGGDGWGGAWVTSQGFFENELFKLDVVEPANPLVYGFPDGGFVNGGNRALTLINEDPENTIDNEGDALLRDFDDLIDADEVYFSFLYRYEGDGTDTGGFIDDNDFVVWWFNGTGGPQMGLKGNFGNGTAPDDFVGRVSGAFAPPQQAYAPAIDISSEAGTLNDTWFLVGKMSRSDHSLEEGDYDQFDLWVNPGIGDEGSPNATGTGAEGDVLALDLDSLGLRVFNQEPGDTMSWDELRIGESWDDVVSILGDQDVVIEQPTCEVPTGGILGDLDGDNEVGFSDFLALSGNFGGMDLTYQEGDIDCNGEVAFADFLVLSTNFGMTTPGAQAVPEPHGLALFGWLTMLGVLRSRKR